MSEFSVNSTSPIAEAKPDTTLPPVVRYPAAHIGTKGDGKIRAKPFAIVGREYTPKEGIKWYADFVSGQSAQVTVRLYDPVSGSWKNYTAQMQRPVTNPDMLSGKQHTGLRVVFNHLEEQ